MIDKNNFKALLKQFRFVEKGDIYSKDFDETGVFLKVDFKKEYIEYPELAGLKINERQTCNFSSQENAVVFECVHKLLAKGYKAKHIELEPKWKLGHGASGGRADILVKDQKDRPLLIIECKTYGKEFNKAWKNTLADGGQLFSYAQQISETDFLCLYASEFDTKNNTLLVAQRIISHKDNQDILQQNQQLKSFAQASDVEQRFKVWNETYEHEATETGLFEENIPAYQIGKNNYTLDIDTRPVTDKDKIGKYHHFRTILRQHNIARRETAFEVLVNLFLAKIVDEEENKNNLEFYWKGVAYDNYYDFIDRLQKLYQIGMRKFLKDEVMYISNTQIDEAFWTVKNKRNATKNTIQGYFRDLKFFSNNAFSLVNVHNERLFNQNTKVLVEIVQMWQGLRLKTKEQNQFLGDMFEYFLDNSIKQSEGQFFTPMPITKFIVASLPLEDKIKKSSEPLTAIDFACGAGHFLTEYAHQIKPLVAKHKETDINHYYENIIGIEKEDRLAKIAKVSAFMYGQDPIKILEEDALSEVAEIKSTHFDVLVANPPFAVKGFLLNLNDPQKLSYELIKTTDLNSDTNNIQCFFIERAKQLMAADGIVGIIVPSSVLSNSDATHIATREILLKYFDIIALVELGGGTFGKTGTNTVVLFLRRKSKRPEPAEHYWNRVEDYFEGMTAGDPSTAEYQDGYLIQKYCEHTELPFNEYKKLLTVSIETITELDELFKTDLFTDYQKNFIGSTEVKNLRKQKSFKAKTQTEQTEELNKRLISYLHAIEKDKLFYFMLSVENPQKVLIIKSPSDNKKQKKFLGYEWSGAKGSEGIKYHGGSTVNEIITPLFDPQYTDNPEKINFLIQQNFLGAEPNDLKGFKLYKDLISYVNVAELLDFSRTDFNKSFSLSAKKDVVIDSKWGLVKLGDVVVLEYGKPLPKSERIKGEYPVYGSNGIIDYHNDFFLNSPTLIIGRKGSAGELNWSDKNCTPIDTTFYVKLINEEVAVLRFLYFILKSLNLPAMKGGSGSGGINRNEVYSRKIPLPPKSVQAQIVTECEVIDQASEKAQKGVDMAKQKIGDKVKTVFNTGFEEKKIGSLLILEYGKPLPEKNRVKGKYPVYGSNGVVGSHNDFFLEAPCLIIGRKGSAGEVNWSDKNCTPIDTTFYVKLIDKEIFNLRFLFYILEFLNLPELKRGSGSGGINRNDIYSKVIPIPPLNKQKQLITEINKLEKQISEAKIIIASTAEKKQAVMDKYLKE